MMRAMVHRGPDDEGYEQFPIGSSDSGGQCGFGFRRLSIMDLSPLGHQPMINRATGDCIAFNGEIYNFKALRARLESTGHRFQSTGDTEVLLRALSTWGDAALDDLDGMFAIAFYQAATRRVLLARDPLGIKPLYVAHIADAVVFASEIRAVMASGMVPNDLDPAGIAGYLAYGAPQDPLTVHRWIRSMPAGTCQWLDGTAIAGGPAKSRRYWRFPSITAARDEAAVVTRVQEELTASVQAQCISDVPLGVFLSGGIDSATMAALAQSSQGPICTFSVGYEIEGIGDETEAAAETAHALGTTHYQTIVDNDWVILQWQEWLKATDRPSVDGLNTFIVSGAVKDRGITVALSGLGADELFGGYPAFRRIPQLRLALSAISFLPRGLRRRVAATLLRPLPASRRAKAVDFLSSGNSAVELAALCRRVMGDDTLRALGFDDRRLGLTPQYLPQQAFDPFTEKPADLFQAISQAETCLYMGNTLLRDSDTNSMAHSLEIRVPFLGRGVVDYTSSLPGKVKYLNHGLPKHLLRKAMAGRIPESVFTRAKKGFSLPFDRWIFGPLREQCESAIAALADAPFFEAASVRRIWSDHCTHPGQTHWSRSLSLVVLGNYLQAMSPTKALNHAPGFVSAPRI
jgi:asparagine synthase (glutamine-hydrolysing)